MLFNFHCSFLFLFLENTKILTKYLFFRKYLNFHNLQYFLCFLKKVIFCLFFKSEPKYYVYFRFIRFFCVKYSYFLKIPNFSKILKIAKFVIWVSNEAKCCTHFRFIIIFSVKYINFHIMSFFFFRTY